MPLRLSTSASLVAALALAAALAACNGSITNRSKAPGTDGGPGSYSVQPPTIPFEPTAPEAYVAKVKNLLTGLPATDDEVSKVKADSTQLKTLIDGWLATPQAQAKLLLFFEKAFQQNQFIAANFVDQFASNFVPTTNTSQQLLVANMQESFARTVLELMKEGRPFTEVNTTNRFMLTPALASTLAFIDGRYMDDNGLVHDQVFANDRSFAVTITDDGGTIDIKDSLTPGGPNYLHFYTAIPFANCTSDSRTFTPSNSVDLALFSAFWGNIRGDPQFPGTADGCNITSGSMQFADTDFTTWKMVTIRPPAGSEQRTVFYDLPTLRSTSTLVLNTPRTGFFTTPAFFATWQTNSSNVARVTANQTMIVALGASFDGADSTVPVSESGLDAEHADPSSPCYSCHKTLDPMRNFFRKSLTVSYHVQQDPDQTSVQPQFAFAGVTATKSSLAELGTLLATHPRFGPAWVQKVCYLVDSAPCSGDDPEYLRVVSAFQANGYDFRAMLIDLLSSPLVTGATETKTADDRGTVISISRYDHLCTALTNRLGIPDACDSSKTATLLSTNIPSDSFSRGSEIPVLNTDPSMFFRGATENLCSNIGLLAVGTGTSIFQISNPTTALTAMVTKVMAIPPGDARAGPALQILTDHYNDAKAMSGQTVTTALRSAFVLACESPTAVSIGL